MLDILFLNAMLLHLKCWWIWSTSIHCSVSVVVLFLLLLPMSPSLSLCLRLCHVHVLWNAEWTPMMQPPLAKILHEDQAANWSLCAKFPAPSKTCPLLLSQSHTSTNAFGHSLGNLRYMRDYPDSSCCVISLFLLSSASCTGTNRRMPSSGWRYFTSIWRGTYMYKYMYIEHQSFYWCRLGPSSSNPSPVRNFLKSKSSKIQSKVHSKHVHWGVVNSILCWTQSRLRGGQTGKCSSKQSILIL